MINRGSYKLDVFWKRVERIFGQATYMGVPLAESDYTRVLNWEFEDVIYLGSGYWRCVPVYHDEDHWFIGIRLINPSCSCDDIDHVMHAFWLIP